MRDVNSTSGDYVHIWGLKLVIAVRADAPCMAHKGVDRNSDVQIQAWFIINTFTCLFTEAEWCIYESVYYPIIGSDNGLSPFRRQAIIWTCDQSGTKPNLVAKILATNFGVFF